MIHLIYIPFIQSLVRKFISDISHLDLSPSCVFLILSMFFDFLLVGLLAKRLLIVSSQQYIKYITRMFWNVLRPLLVTPNVHLLLLLKSGLGILAFDFNWYLSKSSQPIPIRLSCVSFPIFSVFIVLSFEVFVNRVPDTTHFLGPQLQFLVGSYQATNLITLCSLLVYVYYVLSIRKAIPTRR